MADEKAVYIENPQITSTSASAAKPDLRTWKQYFCATRKRACVTGWTTGLLVVAIVLAIALPLGLRRKNPDSWNVPSSPWFISAAELNSIRASVTLLDARNKFGGHIDGAVSAKWTDFVSGANTGVLVSTIALQSRLRNRGVSNSRPVVVYGDWQHGWGEEGRVAWMLDYLNHSSVRILYGGVDAWTMNGGSVTDADPTATFGDFVASPVTDRRATGDDIWQLLQTDPASVLLLDTREPKEYYGATLYNEPRGGHLPTAKLYTWSRIFGEDGGNLRPFSELRSDFAALGARDNSTIIGYCTGGIRSGMLYIILKAIGYTSPRNYDASFWGWSANSTYPVTSGALGASTSTLAVAAALFAVAAQLADLYGSSESESSKRNGKNDDEE